ncbi:hypothetical protein [Ponticaulis sp.]|uniref:hypothetical protein n=1 Tax=Ponticaulis sp. TaxID=2020902 RepID=UPI0025FACA82|nr:hypothetical protein [Ponticaulis sp.]
MHHAFCILLGILMIPCGLLLMATATSWNAFDSPSIAFPGVMVLYFPMYLWYRMGRMKKDYFILSAFGLFAFALAAPIVWSMFGDVPEEVDHAVRFGLIGFMIFYYIACRTISTDQNFGPGDPLLKTFNIRIMPFQNHPWVPPGDRLNRVGTAQSNNEKRSWAISMWPFTVAFLYFEMTGDSDRVKEREAWRRGED